MLDYAIGLEAKYNAEEMTAFGRQANIASIALEIGVATGLSEFQVHRRLTVAERVREQAPQTWAAFRAGRLDAARCSREFRRTTRASCTISTTMTTASVPGTIE